MLVHIHPYVNSSDFDSPLFQKREDIQTDAIQELVSQFLPIVSTSKTRKISAQRNLNLEAIEPYADALFSSARQKAKDINLEIFFSRLLEQIDTESQPELFGGISQKANIIRIWMQQNPHWLAEIRSLDLEGCPLSHLPPEINLLTDLEKLSLSHSSIQKLPDKLDLPFLKTLNISHTNIDTFPDKLELPNLRTLNASHTPISALPKSFSYPDIHWLNLDDPNLQRVLAELENPAPFWVDPDLASKVDQDLPLQSEMSLEHLDLSFTNIKTFPKKFNPPCLISLNLRGTPFAAFNDDFDPPNLEQIDLTDTKVTRLPDGIASRLLEDSEVEN